MCLGIPLVRKYPTFRFPHLAEINSTWVIPGDQVSSVTTGILHPPLRLYPWFMFLAEGSRQNSIEQMYWLQIPGRDWIIYSCPSQQRSLARSTSVDTLRDRSFHVHIALKLIDMMMNP